MENNVFSNKQSGFIIGKSNVMQLLKVINRPMWTECLELGGQIEVILTWRKLSIKYTPRTSRSIDSLSYV